MHISIYTNEVQGGWYPQQINEFLGGGEESIVLFASELAKNHKVEVYSSINKRVDYNHAAYLPRKKFDFSLKYDVLITWKDKLPWILNVQANKKIHWSSSDEDKWSIGIFNKIDWFICFSRYHANRNDWANKKIKVIPLGIDLKSLMANRENGKENIILYCSSPDRGLETVLNNWDKIKGYQLFVTYGRHHSQVIQKCNERGIKVGTVNKSNFERLLWKSKYWILPLNKPDAELFCLNAVKARITGTLPVINTPKGSGLEDTISNYLSFYEFLENQTPIKIHENSNYNTEPLSWEDIIKKYWLEVLN